MISNKVFEEFRSSFESFFADKGIKWCGGCFAGYKNGLFSYVELIEASAKQGTDIDIIYRVLPCFHVSEEAISGSKNCLYTFRMIADTTSRPIDCGLDNTEKFFAECLDILKSEYDRLFYYGSVTEYAQRMAYNCSLLIDYAGKNNEFSSIYGEFPNMDFTYLAYFYLKYNGKEECGNLIKNLINAYKILLYDKMKYGNFAELEEKLNDSQQKKFESLFENYCKLTQFAESMLNNNISFFAETEKAFETKRILGEEFIKNFLVE